MDQELLQNYKHKVISNWDGMIEVTKANGARKVNKVSKDNTVN